MEASGEVAVDRAGASLQLGSGGEACVQTHASSRLDWRIRSRVDRRDSWSWVDAVAAGARARLLAME